MPFSKRTQDALEVALHDREAAYEILSKIVILEQGSSGGSGGVAFDDITGVADVSQLPTTGLSIDQYTSLMTADADAATVTFDASISDWHRLSLGGNRTLVLSEPQLISRDYNCLDSGRFRQQYGDVVRWDSLAGRSGPDSIGRNRKIRYLQVQTDCCQRLPGVDRRPELLRLSCRRHQIALIQLMPHRRILGCVLT